MVKRELGPVGKSSAVVIEEITVQLRQRSGYVLV